jgi:hypothetical protein
LSNAAASASKVRASKGQNLLDQVARPLGAAADGFEMAKRPGIRTIALLRHLGMAENPAQDIVEVMRDTAGEHADGFHAAGLLQARLQPCPLFFHGLPPDGIDDGVERHAQQAEFAGCANAAGPADGIETESDAAAVIVDMGHAGPAAEAKCEAGVLVLSGRHRLDAG